MSTVETAASNIDVDGTPLENLPSNTLVDGTPFEQLPSDYDLSAPPPDATRKALVSRAEIRVAPLLARNAYVSQARMEIAPSTVENFRRAYVAQANMRVGSYQPRSAIVSHAEMDVITPNLPPQTIFEDGFENANNLAWIGGAGGRQASCDCTLVCPGGTPNTNDPLDSFVSDPPGYYKRVTLRHACKSLLASCLNACEIMKYWPNYKLGQTEFKAHRVRVSSPYTSQTGFCLISQLNYSSMKYNALGLNLVGTNLEIFCNLGFADKTTNGDYNNPQGYSLDTAQHPVALDQWHDYIWEITYSTIYGTSPSSPTPGKLKVYHRLPNTTSDWTVLHDSTILHPNGVPTHQWGYALGNDTTMFVDINGNHVSNGTPRWFVDKIGAYRSSNNNNFTVDHRKMCIAASFAVAEAYLNYNN